MTRRSFSQLSAWLGALALASLLWFHAVTEHQYRRRIEIPLRISGPAPGADGQEIVVANSPPATVAVLVSGRGKDLLRLGTGDLVLRLPVPKGPPGSRVSYQLAPEQVEATTNVPVHVEEILEPTEIEIALDRRLQRRVPVRARVQLHVADSYTQVGALRVEPSTVQVSGPRREVERVVAIATDTLILENLREDVERSVALRAPPGRHLSVSLERVTVAANIQEVAEYTIPNVPVQVRGSGGRKIRLEPSRVAVRIRGGADVIYNLDPEEALRLYVDFAAWEADGQDRGQVHVEADSLFEVLEIIPPAVDLVRF